MLPENTPLLPEIPNPSSLSGGFALWEGMKSTYGFSRRGPDRVAEELASVLSCKSSFEFKALFSLVHANLKSRNAAGGGEEMLRLRAYEKLQNLVQAGIVTKKGKEYKGVAAGLVTFIATAAEMNAEFAARKLNRPTTKPVEHVW